MIPNCRGCIEELNMAVESQDLYNLHFVTTKKKCGLNEKSHFHIFMVDDNGKIMIS